MENFNLISICITIALIGYFCSQKTALTFESEVVVESNIDAVYDFMKNPLNQLKIQQTIKHIDIIDQQPELDEKTGHLKDYFKVNIKQKFPYLWVTNYSFTREASSDSKVIVTEGYVLGITYSTKQSLTKQGNNKTEVKEVNTLNLPRIISGLISAQLRQGIEERLSKLKEFAETK